MIRAHAQAVETRLEAQGLTVYDGNVPDQPTYPYVVLYSTAPVRRAAGLDGASRNADTDFQTSAVGTTAEQCRWAQEKVHTALVDARLTITGRATRRVRHELSLPVRADTDVSPHVMYAVDQWGFRSVPS